MMNTRPDEISVAITTSAMSLSLSISLSLALARSLSLKHTRAHGVWGRDSGPVCLI